MAKTLCVVCNREMKGLEAMKEEECCLCHKKFMARMTCSEEHYVCDRCQVEACSKVYKDICMNTKSDNAYEIGKMMFDAPCTRMHGPEHHLLVGFALLTAYKNAGGDIDLEKALAVHKERNEFVPAAFCGKNGSCGAAVSTGAAYSIITDSNILCKETWGESQLITAECLTRAGEIGGPRCCKRDGTLSIITGTKIINKKMGTDIKLPTEKIVCEYMKKNPNCIGKRCPFSPSNKDAKETSEGIKIFC